MQDSVLDWPCKSSAVDFHPFLTNQTCRKHIVCIEVSLHWKLFPLHCFFNEPQIAYVKIKVVQKKVILDGGESDWDWG